MVGWKASNPGVQKIVDGLAAAFAKVEPKIKAELKAGYRAGADRGHEALMRASKDPKYTGYIGGRSGAFDGWYRHTQFDHAAAVKQWERTRKSKDDYSGYPVNSPSHWEDLRAMAKCFSVTYEYADSDANDAFDRARESFIVKNMGKLENVLAKRTDVVENSVTFQFKRERGVHVFEGGLKVRLADASFQGSVGLKFVVRTIPRVTPYFQYPLLFTEAEVGGKIHRGPSEKELRILLGGGPPKTPEEIRAEKGYCVGSAQWAPADAYAKVANRYTPYLGCPKCGQTVSVKGGKYRTHYPKKEKVNG